VAVKTAPTQQLYERDFALWLEEQALALKERRAAELDWDNLAAEIEGLVRSDRRALKSFLRNALLHLLELAYWDSERDRNQRQWRLHLVNARTEMLAIVEDSPSLERYLAEIFEQTYQAARREAEIVIGAQLPEKCDWTVEQVRSDTFYPAPAAVPRKRKR
jgi:hypothetical protein